MVTLLTVVFSVAACGTGHPPAIGDPEPTAVPTQPTDAAGQLAGLVAAAQDRHYVAAYTLTSHDHPNRTVLASVATDGSWRVDIPAGALSGAADVAIVGNATGTYQCLLSGSGTTAATTPDTPPPASSSPGTPSAPPSAPATDYVAPACVKVANAGEVVPHRYDPVFEHLFTDWLDVLADQNAPIDVFTASALPHSTGTCFSVEPSSASLVPPVDAGIFCFAPDGTMTAASIADGALTLDPPAGPAPPTNGLPAPITVGPAAPVKVDNAASG